MTAAKKAPSPELIDQLLACYQKPEDLLGEHGLLKQLTKAVVERALQAEMAAHLGHDKHESVANAAGNTRNGTSRKTLKGEFGELPIEIPRDRQGNFEPQLIPLGLWGSIASIVSLALYFFPSLASSQPERTVQAITSGSQSPAIGENQGSVTINYGAPSTPHEKSYVLRNKVSGATQLISRPSLDAAADPKNYICIVPAGTHITLTGESAKMSGIDMWRKVKIASGECANKSGWVAIDNVSLE